MKDMNQNMASGGRAAEGNFRQLEIRGRGVSTGDFPQIVFFVVRIYYLKNAIYQGFRQNWPVTYCASHAQGRRKFLPNLSIDDE
jgi:hypothetical protein